MTARSWCFTSFAENLSVLDNHKDFRYIIYAQETCPETGNKHWQGYIELKSPLRFTQVQQIIGDCSAHCEKRKGSRDQARDYCMKEQGALIIECGEWERGGAGTRNDLEDLKKSIKAGKPLLELFDDHPTAWRLTKSMTIYRQLVAAKNKRPFKPKTVIILEGPPGCGKSKWVDENYPEHYVKKKGKWFDGYAEESTIFIDEFVPEDWNIQDLNMLLDGRDYIWECKGSSILIKADVVVIATNIPSESWYRDKPDEIRGALFRRITLIKNFWKTRNLPVSLSQDTERGGNTKPVVTSSPPLLEFPKLDLLHLFNRVEPWNGSR
nr:MAG: replication associated protein [Cressdnaviricota sp.]